MKRSLRASLLSAAILPFLGPFAMSQQQLNEIQLTNGGDGLFIYDDPTPGMPVGASDATNNYIWKVFPKEVMRAADGSGPHQMEYNGLVFNYFDTEWSTDGPIYDIALTRGMPSGLTDNIGPDFTDPNGVLITFGTSWLTFSGGAGNPCLLTGNPLGCVGACPPAGQVVGYIVEVNLIGAGGPNGGILVAADGATDFVTSSFLPPGMTFSTGSGPCALGDYILEDLHSSNVFGGTPGEFQVATGSGNSPYGGFSVTAGIAADATSEVQDQQAEFQQMVVEGRTSYDPVFNPALGTTGLGLSSLRFSVAAGTANYGSKVVAASHVGDFGFVFGSTFPQLAYPGIQAFGIDFLINLADPLVNTTSSFWNGTIALVNNGGAPYDDGWATYVLLPVPAIAAGLPFNMQGYTLNFSSFAFDASGTFGASFLP